MVIFCLLIQQKDSVLPVFDTTIIHAISSTEYTLEGPVPRRNTNGEGISYMDMR